MISAHSRPICSARSALNAELAPLSFSPFCNTEAMQLHLDEIATRVTAGAHAILILDQAGWHGAKDLKDSQQSSAPAAAAACARAQPPRKHLAVHVPELAVEPYLPILRLHRRSLLLRMEHTDRSALENHVHRTPRLGLRRSLNLRNGIIGQKHTFVQGCFRPAHELSINFKIVPAILTSLQQLLPAIANQNERVFRPCLLTQAFRPQWAAQDWGIRFGDCSKTTFATIVGPNLHSCARYHGWLRLIVRR